MLPANASVRVCSSLPFRHVYDANSPSLLPYSLRRPHLLTSPRSEPISLQLKPPYGAFTVPLLCLYCAFTAPVALHSERPRPPRPRHFRSSRSWGEGSVTPTRVRSYPQDTMDPPPVLRVRLATSPLRPSHASRPPPQDPYCTKAVFYFAFYFCFLHLHLHLHLPLPRLHLRPPPMSPPLSSLSSPSSH